MGLPSKELLSEVLGFEIDAVFYYNDNLVFFQKTLDKKEYHINIHELAHKCKEWALKQENIDSIVSSTYKCLWTNTVRNICDVNGRSEFSPDGYVWKYDYKAQEDTEPEAIFKACQWILDNKDK